MTTDSADRRREDRVAWFIFATLIAMSAVLVTALLVEEKPYQDVVENGVSQRVYNGHGVAHPKFAVTHNESGDAQAPSMLHGGDGRERHENVVVLACAFAMLCVIFGVSCIYMGSLRSAGPSPLKWPLVLVALVGCTVMVAMFVTYWRSLGAAEPSYFLGFPVPTAWMMFGVYSFPILIVICFVAWFDRWYAPPQINEEFRQIMTLKQDGQIGGSK
jgi:hypothetical protein